MNFTTGNPTEIPICVRCNTSRSLEQFSKSQRKRWKQKKTATCKKCQNGDSGNKHEETNHNVKVAKKGSMCICIPQPFGICMFQHIMLFLASESSCSARLIILFLLGQTSHPIIALHAIGTSKSTRDAQDIVFISTVSCFSQKINC